MFPYSSNKDLSVINTSLFYFTLLTYFIYLFLCIIIFFLFFIKEAESPQKFAIDTNFVTYCLNYFVSGMPFEGLANANVSESVIKKYGTMFLFIRYDR